MTRRYTTEQLQRVRDLLTRLSAALRAARFYPVRHRVPVELAESLLAHLDTYFAEDAEILLTFHEGEIIFGDQVLTEESILFDQLNRSVEGAGIECVRFRPGLTAEELDRALRVMSVDSSRRGTDLATAVRAARLEHVDIGRAAIATASLDSAVETLQGRLAAKTTYESSLGVLRQLELVTRKRDEFEPELAGDLKGTVQALIGQLAGNRPSMVELSRLKTHDDYTFYHAVNVAILSLGVASSLSDDKRFLASVGVGALLHDIGKLHVDLAVLSKPGALNLTEREAIMLHPVFGAQIAASVPGLDRSAIVVIFEHHRRLDGSGYPQAFPGRRQAIGSRIVAIADTYDAMTSNRPYAAARPPEEAARQLMLEAGTRFDAGLVRLFLRLIGVYPPRSLVRLTTGELGVVVHADPLDRERPFVNIITDCDENPLDEMVGVALMDDSQRGRDIERTLDPGEYGIDVEDYLA